MLDEKCGTVNFLIEGKSSFWSILILENICEDFLDWDSFGNWQLVGLKEEEEEVGAGNCDPLKVKSGMMFSTVSFSAPLDKDSFYFCTTFHPLPQFFFPFLLGLFFLFFFWIIEPLKFYGEYNNKNI